MVRISRWSARGKRRCAGSRWCPRRHSRLVRTRGGRPQPAPLAFILAIDDNVQSLVWPMRASIQTASYAQSVSRVHACSQLPVILSSATFIRSSSRMCLFNCDCCPFLCGLTAELAYKLLCVLRSRSINQLTKIIEICLSVEFTAYLRLDMKFVTLEHQFHAWLWNSNASCGGQAHADYDASDHRHLQIIETNANQRTKLVQQLSNQYEHYIYSTQPSCSTRKQTNWIRRPSTPTKANNNILMTWPFSTKGGKWKTFRWPCEGSSKNIAILPTPEGPMFMIGILDF